MWEQLDLFTQHIVVSKKQHIYLAKQLTEHGLSDVGHFVSSLDESEILIGQVVVAANTQLFVVEKQPASGHIVQQNGLLRVQKTQQNLEQYLAAKLKADYTIIRTLFDE